MNGFLDKDRLALYLSMVIAILFVIGGMTGILQNGWWQLTLLVLLIYLIYHLFNIHIKK